MRIFKVFSLAALAAVVASSAWADMTRVAALGGTVDIQKEPDAAWAGATVGAEVPEGGSVRTSGDGRCELLYPDGSHVWLKENTQVSIETQRSLLSRLSLVWGSMKARIPHLASNRRMEFKTSTAVAAVRGTELVITQDKSGKYDLNVLFGNVDLRQTGVPKAFSVPQGRGFGVDEAGKPGKARLLSRNEEVRGLEDWHPNMTPEDRIKGIQDKEEKRQEVHNYARQEEERQQELQSILSRAKEDDMEAGRTLNDVHGNLVRVSQLLLRPSEHEIQFVNLVKRPVYNYVSGKVPFSAAAPYLGPATITNRLDSMQARLDFGAGNPLPLQITAWPQFFSANKVQTESVIFANMTAMPNLSTGADIFEIAFSGTRDPVTGNLPSNLYVGRLKEGVNCTSVSTCLGAMTDFSNSGGARFEAFTNDTSGTKEQTLSGSLGEFTATPWVSGADHIWLTQNNMVIDNNGALRSVSDFTNSSSDPFSILKDSSFETILQVKQNVGGNIGGDFCNGAFGNACGSTTAKNIDLVVIPDIPMAALTLIATSGSSIKTGN